MIANRIATTREYEANTNQALLHPAIRPTISLSTGCTLTRAFTTACAPSAPIVEPKPFVININKPCALERISVFVFWSTNNEPEILKKSNATP